MDVNRLKGLIVQRGFSQTYLAKELGITLQNFNAKCNSRAVFNLDELKKLSDLLCMGSKEIWEIFFEPVISNMK